MQSQCRRSAAPLLCTAASLAVAAGAAAQSLERAVFVANNGNVEGAVTSYTLPPDGVPRFIGKYVTGAGSGNGGNNAYAIALTPSGEFLATTHATAVTSEQINIFRVGSSAELTHVGTFLTPDSPLAAAWLNDTHLAVTLTNLSAPNQVIVYRFEPSGPSLVEVDREPTGGFTGYLAVNPDRQYLYAQDSPLSGGSSIAAFRIEPDGTLTAAGVVSTSPYYALGPGISPDGLRLYGGGGTSTSTDNFILGFDINPLDGSLSHMPSSPFVSPGSAPSPKQCVVSTDNRFVLVGHGRSSEVRSFAIGEHGGLTDTGFANDVGIQGDLGGVAVLDDLVLFTRKYSGSLGPTGLLSFTLQQDGSFTPNGGVVSSQGSLPQYIAVWSPPGACYANCDGSAVEPVLNVTDFICFQTRFAAADPYANCDGSTVPPVLNVADFICFQSAFAAGCS